MTTIKPAKIHIVDRDGKLVYTRLWDCGPDTNTLTFDSGYGFVARDEMRRIGYSIRPGWKKTAQEMNR